MPCYDSRNDDEIRALHGREQAIVPACLDEIKTGKPFTYFDGQGAYKGVAQSRKEVDAAAAELCALCKTIDVTKYSLELQMWWRDHQKWDRQRGC